MCSPTSRGAPTHTHTHRPVMSTQLLSCCASRRLSIAQAPVTCRGRMQRAKAEAYEGQTEQVGASRALHSPQAHAVRHCSLWDSAKRRAWARGVCWQLHDARGMGASGGYMLAPKHCVHHPLARQRAHATAPHATCLSACKLACWQEPTSEQHGTTCVHSPQIGYYVEMKEGTHHTSRVSHVITPTHTHQNTNCLESDVPTETVLSHNSNTTRACPSIPLGKPCLAHSVQDGSQQTATQVFCNCCQRYKDPQPPISCTQSPADKRPPEELRPCTTHTVILTHGQHN